METSEKEKKTSALPRRERTTGWEEEREIDRYS